MKLRIQNKSHTLGDWAAKAIDKHFHKFTKHEADVLEDKNPEDLHQMRVGLRRLRSAIVGFGPALDLPKAVSDKKIGKIGHKLGTLRDLDVLREVLEQKIKPALPPKEQKTLETALASLGEQRRQALEQVRDTLKHERYQSLKQAVKKWLKQPAYQEIAQMPMQEVLPDLLLPEVSKVLLHPGWLVGTEVKEGEIIVPEAMSPEMVEQKLAQGPILHSLRKETKRLRYQMELFTQFYGSNYQAYLQDVKTIQETLGQIQDGVVLAEFLQDALKSEIQNLLPTLANQLVQTRYESWQKWQDLQQRYLNPETRQNFHLTILQPIQEEVNDEESN